MPVRLRGSPSTRVAGSQCTRVRRYRLQRRGKPHLLEHIQPIVTRRRPLPAKPRCPRFRIFDHRRDAGPELQVRAGAVEHLYAPSA